MRIRAALAVLAFCPALLAQQPAAATLVMKDVNLIDGTGRTARAHATVVISGGRIASVDDAAAEKLPRDASIWDLHGMTIIPGLFDSHVHLTAGPYDQPASDELLRFGFMGGVTSVRDMGGDAIQFRDMSQRAAQPNMASPRIYFSTLVAGPEWFRDPRAKGASHGGVPGEVAWMHAITPQSNIPAIIAAGKATGATGLKIYADLTPDLVEKATAEAHREGLRVWSHSAIFPTRPSETVRAGVDVVSHSVYLGAEGMSKPPESYEQARRGDGIDYSSSPVNGPAITALLQLMHARGTMLDETLFVTHLAHRDDSDPIWRWTHEVTKRAHELGVQLVAGTDDFANPRKEDLPNIHTEMELLVTECGLTPLEAIYAATYEGARAVGAERDYGTIEPGKVADLVVLQNDPSGDIRQTRRIEAVMKAGAIYHIH